MPPKTGVAPDTLITGWLILGAFPNPDPARILAAPYLPEPLLAPSPGERVAHLAWRPVYQENGMVDLIAIGLHPREYCAALCLHLRSRGAERFGQAAARLR
jgi:hypothetical protein